MPDLTAAQKAQLYAQLDAYMQSRGGKLSPDEQAEADEIRHLLAPEDPGWLEEAVGGMGGAVKDAAKSVFRLPDPANVDRALGLEQSPVDFLRGVRPVMDTMENLWTGATQGNPRQFGRGLGQGAMLAAPMVPKAISGLGKLLSRGSKVVPPAEAALPPLYEAPKQLAAMNTHGPQLPPADFGESGLLSQADALAKFQTMGAVGIDAVDPLAGLSARGRLARTLLPHESVISESPRLLGPAPGSALRSGLMDDAANPMVSHVRVPQHVPVQMNQELFNPDMPPPPMPKPFANKPFSIPRGKNWNKSPQGVLPAAERAALEAMFDQLMRGR